MSATCYSYRRQHLKRTGVIRRMLFTPATVPLFAKQAVVKHVLAVHTSVIEQLKHATDTDMRPLPSLCIACTDRLIHRKCTRRCHAFILWGWHFWGGGFCLFLLLTDHFFFHFKIFRMLNFRH